MLSNGYHCFIGRFVNFHDGHKYIINKKANETNGKILIMIMDTNEESDAHFRQSKINCWIKENKIDGMTMIIPPILSVNYGRNVGYEISYIDSPENIQQISGEKIRKGLIDVTGNIM